MPLLVVAYTVTQHQTMLASHMHAHYCYIRTCSAGIGTMQRRSNFLVEVQPI